MKSTEIEALRYMAKRWFDIAKSLDNNISPSQGDSDYICAMNSCANDLTNFLQELEIKTAYENWK